MTSSTSTLIGASTIAVAATGVGTSPTPIPPEARSFFIKPVLLGIGGRFLGGTELLKTLLFNLLSPPGGFEPNADDDVAADEAVVRDVEVVVTGDKLEVVVVVRRGGCIAGVVSGGTDSNPLTV